MVELIGALVTQAAQKQKVSHQKSLNLWLE
jgi:hypothetical protein